MTSRYTPPMTRAGSYGKAVATFHGIYPESTVPIPEMLTTRSGVVSSLPGNSTTPGTGSMVVNRRNRVKGMRFLYATGAKFIRNFVMIATGAVQSSKFQPYSAWTWDGSFNDELYAVGYPGTNLGISEKVPTIPKSALGITPTQMQPRPQYRRTIFTQRSFGGQPGLPAQGTRNP